MKGNVAPPDDAPEGPASVLSLCAQCRDLGRCARAAVMSSERENLIFKLKSMACGVGLFQGSAASPWTGLAMPSVLSHAVSVALPLCIFSNQRRVITHPIQLEGVHDAQWSRGSCLQHTDLTACIGGPTWGPRKRVAMPGHGWGRKECVS